MPPRNEGHGPNHHLWRNGRLWWVAFVVLVNGSRQLRVRRSLKTDRIELARRRRDAIIRAYERRAGYELPLTKVRRRQRSNDSRRPAALRRIT